MSRRIDVRKPGTSRHRPRPRSCGTAETPHITCQAGKLWRDDEWGGWGQLSVEDLESKARLERGPLGQSDEGRLNGGAQKRSVSSAQYEESDDDSGEHEGRTQTARHGFMGRGGRPRLINRPCSRTGENPPYGILGRAIETSASYEARSAPSLYPTGGPKGLNWERPPCTERKSLNQECGWKDGDRGGPARMQGIHGRERENRKSKQKKQTEKANRKREKRT